VKVTASTITMGQIWDLYRTSTDAGVVRAAVVVCGTGAGGVFSKGHEPTDADERNAAELLAAAWNARDGNSQPAPQPALGLHDLIYDIAIDFMAERCPKWTLTENRDNCRLLAKRVAEAIEAMGSHPSTSSTAPVGYVTNRRLAEIARSAERAAQLIELSVTVNTQDLRLLVAELQRRREKSI